MILDNLIFLSKDSCYDDNGNLTSDGNLNYQYDSNNQLIKVIKVSDASTVATYEYDNRGLRIRKTTATGTVRYHYDSDGLLVRESNTNGTTLARYTYHDYGNLVAIEKNNKMYYPHTNLRGDIICITDSNKAVVAQYKYGPWGELISRTGTLDQPFSYAGYYYDGGSGTLLASLDFLIKFTTCLR